MEKNSRTTNQPANKKGQTMKATFSPKQIKDETNRQNSYKAADAAVARAQAEINKLQAALDAVADTATQKRAEFKCTWTDQGSADHIAQTVADLLTGFQS